MRTISFARVARLRLCAPRSTREIDWRGIVLFLLLAYGTSWALWIGLRSLGVPFILRAVLGMFGPALGAVLVRGPLFRRGFVDSGARLNLGQGGGRAYVAAFALPPVLLTLALFVAVASGMQHWAPGANPHVPVTLNPSLTPSNVLFSVALLLVLLGFAPIINALFAFGEEFGWRGYLLPGLVPLGGLRAALLVGVIWGIWHAPLIVLDGYNFPGHPWLGVIAMVVWTMPASVILSWLRFRSGSVWPPAIAHGALNAQAALVVLALSPADSLLAAPVGLLGAVPFAAFATWLALTGRLGEHGGRG